MESWLRDQQLGHGVPRPAELVFTSAETPALLPHLGLCCPSWTQHAYHVLPNSVQTQAWSLAQPASLTDGSTQFFYYLDLFYVPQARFSITSASGGSP